MITTLTGPRPTSATAWPPRLARLRAGLNVGLSVGLKVSMKVVLTVGPVLGLLAGCATAPPAAEPRVPAFKAVEKSDHVVFPTAAELQALEAPEDVVLRLGAGDVLSLQVWGRPELSGRHTIGPDGVISVPIAGPTQVALLTREEAAARVRQGLERFYEAPHVQFGVEQYTSNRITVLGRVQNPGLLNFDHPPTLLEALAKAGSLPVIDKQATLTRCAIFRGRDKVIWVDLKRLLNGGQTHLNLRMRPGDLVYIPDSADTMVYVLGAVHRPGAYRLTPDMSVMDALATAGGPNEDAQAREIGVYRPARQAVERIALQNLMDARQRVNFALEEGDVIFVPKSGIAEFGYTSRQLAAGLSLLTVGTVLGR
jgi:polysaccharide export outer membrane protein